MTCSPVPSKTHHRGPGSFMQSQMCGGTNRLKGLCTTQEQAFINRSKKKGATMVFKPDGLGRQPYSKLNIRQRKNEINLKTFIFIHAYG